MRAFFVEETGLDALLQIFDSMAGALKGETIKHPAVVLVIVLALSCALGIFIGQPFVWSSDFSGYRDETNQAREQIKTSVDGLTTTVNGLNTTVTTLGGKVGAVEKRLDCIEINIARSSLEGRLQAAESELWSLEREIKAGEHTTSMIKRADTVRSTIGSLTRDLDDMGRCEED